jgi:hypothetical protein
LCGLQFSIDIDLVSIELVVVKQHALDLAETHHPSLMELWTQLLKTSLKNSICSDYEVEEFRCKSCKHVDIPLTHKTKDLAL